MSTGRRYDWGKLALVAIAAILALWIVQNGCRQIGFTDHSWGAGGWWLPGWLNVFGFGFLIQTGLAVWVGIDAHRRGMQGLLWGLLVFFTSIVGLLVYAIVCTGAIGPREGGPELGAVASEPTVACPACARAVRPEYRHCPACGASLSSTCRSCGRATDPAWNVCAYCGARLSGESREP